MYRSMWGSREEHSQTESFAEVYEKVFASQRVSVPFQKSNSAANSRLYGLQRVIDALMPAPDGFPYWQITTACPNLIRTLPELPFDPEKPEDVDTDAEDHAYDDCRYFWSSRPELPKRYQRETDDSWPLMKKRGTGATRLTQRALGRSV